MRFFGIELWLELYPVSSSPKWLIEIQNRFFVHFKKKAEENLKQLWYPMITRYIFILEGFQFFGSDKKWQDNNVLKTLFNLLAEHLSNAFDKDAERAKDLLPSSIEFLKEKNSLKKVEDNEAIIELKKV